MEIQDVGFTRFYAAEYIQFGEEVSELIAVAPFRDELPAFNTYLALCEEEKRIFKKLTGSYLTPELERCDKTHGIHMYSFFTVAKGLCHHYDQEVIAAVDIVAKALKPYKHVSKITFNQETATLSRMIAELKKDEFAVAVSRLGLTEWVNTIDVGNRRFADLVLLRNATLAEKVEGNMKDIRSRVDPAYYDLVRHLNALVVVNGKVSYAPAVKQLNLRINTYKHTIAQRQAATATKKKDNAQSVIGI